MLNELKAIKYRTKRNIMSQQNVLKDIDALITGIEIKKDKLLIALADDCKLLFDIIYDELNIEQSEIEGKIRNRTLVNARAIFCHILRKKAYAYKRIGEKLGRDHSTIIHSVRNADDWLISDKDFQFEYDRINKLFNPEDENTKTTKTQAET